MDMLETQLIMLAAGLLVAGAKSVKPLAASGVVPAKAERQFDTLIQLQVILNNNFVVLNIFLVIMLASNWGLFQSIAAALIWLVLVNLLAGLEAVEKRATRIFTQHQKAFLSITAALQPALDLLGSSRFFTFAASKPKFETRDELLEAIQESKHVLSEDELARIRRILKA